jgi:hypothetical protein
MKRLSLITIVLLPLAAIAPPLRGQPKPGAADLPVTHIVLFSSGVGYFQREGVVEGDARIDLQFPMQDVNDLLKSLVLQDAGGGRVGTIHYDNRNPVEKTLKSFAVDLTDNPTLGQLLNQVRGERVEVVTYADRSLPAQAETVTGLIVGVEHKKQAVGKEVIDIEQVNLLTADGLHGVPLGQVQRVRFLKPALEQEFRKALEVLAAAHDKQKKTVSLNFTGQGRRAVRVGYVTESPMWKTSYLLKLNRGEAFLQGWAVVENTTDDDWTNVRLGLVSGRPISFQMDLYEPLFVPRPVVEPELFASLRPPTYQGDLQQRVPYATGAGDQLRRKFAGDQGHGEGKAKDMPKMQEPGEAMKKLAAINEKRDRGIEFQEGVASAALTTELGEYFEYLIEKPVSLPRQKSALLPIVNQPVQGTRVSIYNPTVHAKFPLLGLRFQNSTKLHLTQGPITVFDADSYAGDARIPDIKPGETRLLSYAIDLGTEVEPVERRAPDALLAVKAVKGILYVTDKLQETKTYTVKNRGGQSRVVLIEHPYRPDWKLVRPEKPAERSRDVYRFEVVAEPDKPIMCVVVEEQQRTSQVLLTNTDDERIRFFLRASVTSPKVKAALEEALALKGKLAETRARIQKEENALAVIEKDQGRMRANMERVPPTTDAYKRYVKKFDEQETEIEKRRAEITKLQETAEQQQKAYDTFLARLNVE